ncbi:MAG: hypothetical protein QM703_27780 [Gemmatales bacterium]
MSFNIMKVLFVVLLATVIIIVCINVYLLPDISLPDVITIESAEIGKRLRVPVEVINNSSEDFYIEKLLSSCVCNYFEIKANSSFIKVDRIMIDKHSKNTIYINHRINGVPGTTADHHVMIDYTAGGRQHQHKLALVVEKVNGGIRLTPDPVNLGNLSIGENKTVDLLVEDFFAIERSITACSLSKENGGIRLSKSSSKRNPDSGAMETTISIECAFAEACSIENDIVLYFSDNSSPTKVPLSGKVAPLICLTKDIFVVAYRDDQKTYTCEFKDSSRENQPHIDDVQFTDPDGLIACRIAVEKGQYRMHFFPVLSRVSALTKDKRHATVLRVSTGGRWFDLPVTFLLKRG